MCSTNSNPVHRLFAATLLAGFLAACGGGGGGGGNAVNPPPPPPPVVRTPQKVVFIAEDTTLGQRHLYTAGDEGNDLTALTEAFGNPDGRVLIFSVSPDGENAAYVADATANNSRELFIVAIGGGSPVRIDTGFPAGTNLSEFSWSPDSSQLAYVANPLGRTNRGFAINEVFLVDRDGSNHRKISGSVGSPAVVQLSNIAWSPDGRYLAQMVSSLSPFLISVGYNVFDSTLGTQNSTRISPPVDSGAGERFERDYAWTAASDGIVYRASPEGRRIDHVYFSAADDSGTARISPNLAANGRTFSIQLAPDGQKVAFIADTNGDLSNELWVADIDGGSPLMLATTLSVNGRFFYDWAPGSTQLVYSTDKITADLSEVFVVDADGQNDMRISPSLPAGRFAGRPSWSPDGQLVAYFADQIDDDFFEIFVAETDGSNARSISADVTATTAYGASAWSPDSSKMFFVQHTSGLMPVLYAATADGLSTHPVNAPLVGNEDLDPFRTYWSDDSTRVLYATRIEDGFIGVTDFLDIWVGTTDGAAPIMMNGTFDYRGNQYDYQ